MQKTNFKFEILIGIEYDDDDQYVSKIKAKNDNASLSIFRNSKESLIYIEGTRTGRGNMLNLLRSSKGRYICFCEGDDYWIDSNKLQKQVDVLKEYPEVSLVYTNAKIESDDGGDYISNSLFYDSNYSSVPIKNQKYFLENNYAILLASIMFRRKNLGERDLEELKKYSTGDLPMYIIISGKGDFHYINEACVSYTDHAQGISKTFGKLKRNIINYNKMGSLLPYIQASNIKKFNYFQHQFLIVPSFQFMMEMVKRKDSKNVNFFQFFFVKLKHMKLRYIYYALKLTYFKLKGI